MIGIRTVSVFVLVHLVCEEALAFSSSFTSHCAAPFTSHSPAFPLERSRLPPRYMATKSNGGSLNHDNNNDSNKELTSSNNTTTTTTWWLRASFRSFFKNLWNGMTLPFFPFRGARFLRKKSSQQDKPSFGFSIRDSLMAIVIYLLLGVLAYCCIWEHWSVLDALYFSVTSFTTVGYGDLSPDTTKAKFFTCIFGLGGVAFLGAALASIGSNLVQAEAAAVKAAQRASRDRIMHIFERMPQTVERHKKKEEKEGGSEVAQQQQVQQEEQPTNNGTWRSDIVKIVRKMFPSFGMLCAGGMIMGRLEGWSWTNAIYYSIITAGTVGYGDFAPVSKRGRMWAILYIPLAVAAAGDVLGSVASLYLDRARRQVYQSNQKLTATSLKKMDSNGDGKVSRREYVEFMLVEMQIVERQRLDELHAQFDRLDVSNSGYLEEEDLKIMTELRRKGVDLS